MKPVDTLYVAWRSPETRAIYPVARLTYQPESPCYEFTYIAGALDAQMYGFNPFLGLQDLGQRYLGDELLPLFSNRLMSGSRPDYQEYVARLGLDPARTDALTLLGRSAGLRPADKIEFFAPPQQDEVSGRLVWHFLVRGVRYMPLAEERIDRLVPGERLRFMLDRQNDFDPHAIALRTDNNYLLGFMPFYFAEDMNYLVEKSHQLVILVEKVNPRPAPVHHRILCRLEGGLDQPFHPFRSPRYVPLAPGARGLR